jgi:PAS domain S-box-containing protein
MSRSEELSREQLLDRQTFQLGLLDQLQDQNDPAQIAAMATAALAQKLAAGRCGFASVAPDGAALQVEAEQCQGMPALLGKTHVHDVAGAEGFAALRRGETLVVEDTTLAAQARGQAPDGETRSMIVYPLLRNGSLDALLYVHEASPRAWSAQEITLVQDVAFRAREAFDRASAQAQLRTGEQRYRELFNSIDIGFCIIKVSFAEDGRPTDYLFLEVNDAFAAQSGITDAPGRWMREIAPDHEQHWFDLYGRVAKTGIPEQVELPAAGLDGRWFMVNAYRIDAPELHHVAVLFSDLTGRKETERALERSREELEAAAAAADLGRYDYRPREGRLTWDDRCRALFGLSPGVPVSYEGSFLAGLHPDDREAANAAVAAALDPAGPGRFDAEYRTIGIEDGALRYVSAHGLAFFDNGAAARLIGTVQDVTKDREATAALREVSERLRLASRATNDAIWDWDLRTDHVTWNEALFAVYGHPPSDAEQTSHWWLDNMHPDDRSRVYASIHLVIDSDATDWSDEYRFRRYDGSYADVLDRGYLIRDADGTPIRMVGALLDVTTRKATERLLEQEHQRLVHEIEETTAERDRAEEALRQSQKMEAVGQLTGGLAHDFNNLLTGISGALEMMQLRITQGRVTELEKYSVAAQGAVRRAAALTHRLLAFSRRQTLDPRPTDVNRLIFDVEELIRRTVGPHVEVETLGKAGLWTTLVDPNQLENAIINLCINARDAMPDGGRITIETANCTLDEREARERDLAPGEYVSVSVTDTGTGMAPDVVSRAFDPFFTTKPIGEGTGLGLSMIYGFARQSGGHVRIDTHLGAGTTMCIYLPRHMEAPDVEAEAGTGSSILEQDAPTDAGCILVVDDEPTVRMLVVEVAEDLGYDVMEAFDGQSAMRIIQTHAGIDLLITDVGLPGGMNGRQIADAALSLRPALKVLFITGYAENAVIGSGQLAPNMALVTKPFAMDSLAARIREIMD